MTVRIFMDNYPKIITKYQSTVILLNYMYSVKQKPL